MKFKVQFISLDEDDKDLILSFAVEDSHSGSFKFAAGLYATAPAQACTVEQ